MEAQKEVVTMKGNPLSLIGTSVDVGNVAPDFEVLDETLSPVKFSEFAGKVCVISAVPSLDTEVCDMQTRRFNEEAEKLGPDVQIITISMDLPFAQSRWCGAAGISNIKVFSDYRDVSFGQAYGVVIAELRLLARSIFVVDKDGILRYKEIVSELTNEPDYDSAIEAVKQLL